MNYILTVKKLGCNWYVDINHSDPNSIYLGEKISRALTILDKQSEGQLTLELIETHSLIHDNTMWFNESDLLRYFITDFSFPIRFMYQDRDFSISSDLYEILEKEFNPNFHKTLYNLEIHNYTV